MKNTYTVLIFVCFLAGCNDPSSVVSGSTQSSTSTSSGSSVGNSNTTTAQKVYTNFAYVAMNGSVAAFKIDPDNGEMLPASSNNSVLTGSAGITQGTCQIKINPTGKFLFASNCTGSSVASFVIDQTTGLLTPVNSNVIANAIQVDSSGTAGYFAVDSSSLYILDYESTVTNLIQYSVNQTTGALTQTSTVAFHASGFTDGITPYLSAHSLSTTNAVTASLGIHTYKINSSTGLIDQYDSGSLSAYSARVSGSGIPQSIIIK